MSILENRNGFLFLSVQVAPRASCNAVRGIHNNALKIALCAPPVEGEANAALVDLLSELLDIPKQAVEIVRGGTSKRKSVKLSGIDLSSAERKILGAL